MAANCQVSEARIDFSGSHTHTQIHTPSTAHPPTRQSQGSRTATIPCRSIPMMAGPGCASGLAVHGGTREPESCCWRRHTRVLHGTMAPSWASTAHVGRAATAVWPTRHSDHLAEAHSLSWAADCGLPSGRIPYRRYELGPDQFAQHRGWLSATGDHPVRVWDSRPRTITDRYAAAARDGPRRRAADGGWLRRGPPQDEAVQTTTTSMPACLLVDPRA